MLVLKDGVLLCSLEEKGLAPGRTDERRIPGSSPNSIRDKRTWSCACKCMNCFTRDFHFTTDFYRLSGHVHKDREVNEEVEMS